MPLNLDDVPRELREAAEVMLAWKQGDPNRDWVRYGTLANPENIKALLDERDELQAKVAEIREWAVSTLALDPPAWADSRVVGTWRGAARSVLMVLDKSKS